MGARRLTRDEKVAMLEAELERLKSAEVCVICGKEYRTGKDHTCQKCRRRISDSKKEMSFEERVIRDAADHCKDSLTYDTEIAERLRFILEQLPSKERQIIELYYQEGFDARQIAEKLSVTRSFVYQYKQRALRMVGRKLQNFGDIQNTELPERVKHALIRSGIRSVDELQCFVERGGDLKSIRQIWADGGCKIIKLLTEIRKGDTK